MKKQKFEPQYWDIIRDPKSDPVELSEAILCAGCDRLEQLIPTIEGYMTHPHEMVRGEAYGVLLGFFRLKEHLDAGLEALEKDPSPLARGDIAHALRSYVGWDAKPHKDKRILRALAARVKHDESAQVVTNAYHAMLEILRPDIKPSTFKLDIDRDRDVDWSIVTPYLSN